MPKIVYEDSEVVVALKPRGVLSEGNGKDGLPDLLGDRLDTRLFTVHRLDRDTAGLVVLARSGKIAGVLSTAMQEGRFGKEYAAVCHGAPSPREGEMRDLLFRDATRGKSFIVDRMRHGVREAHLAYRTGQTKDGLSLVMIKLGTGRTHQIRVQFAGRGLPLFGDGRYGGRERAPLGLFAFGLTFPHPKHGGEMSFHAPLPFEEEAFSRFSPD